MYGSFDDDVIIFLYRHPPSLSSLINQVGFFVGIPSQVFGSPSPHFQLPKLRWLFACLTMSVYANVLLMPGTLGYVLAFMFEQVRMGSTNRQEALVAG